MEFYLDGIGLCGPGLKDWQDAIPKLSGTAPYHQEATIVPVSELLPATERRRTVPTVKLAMAVGSAALAHAHSDPATIATVFTSSGGDGQTVHAILEVLASEMREVSPTRFHNSVHNAPSGYWNIATGSREPTTSLCCYNWSFAAGLLDAAAMVIADQRSVVLISYDLPYPEPLHALRPVLDVFGVALVLTPEQTKQSFARLTLDLKPEPAKISQIDNAELEALRQGNPAARSLPLLAAWAQRQSATIILDYLGTNHVVIKTEPLNNDR